MNTHSAWVEVDSAALKHNLEQVRSVVAENVRVMAVVKADAYGHGIVGTAKAFVEAGADALAVTRLDEAAQLRAAGINAEILVFESIQPEMAEEAVALDVHLTVCSPELVEALGKAAAARYTTARVHMKIDSGMGRLGVMPSDAAALARKIAATPAVAQVGTYTHFATSSEKNLEQARYQMARFHEAVQAIKVAFLDPGVVHAANSAAILRLPESHFDMVRPGTILYAQYPSRYVPRRLKLQDTWALKARVSFVKTVPQGYSIGYGAEHKTKKESSIAVIPLGWADGLSLAPESLYRRSILRTLIMKLLHRPVLTVKINGRKAPVVGRIAMQMCSVDVTKLADAKAGDEVTVPCRRVTVSASIPRIYR